MQGGGGLEEWARAFDRFFSTAHPVSTYQPVLALALVDAGRWDDDEPLVGRQWIRDEGQNIRVDLDFLAVRFAKFYWDMVAGFSARHAPERMADPDNPAMDALNIIKVINDEIRKREKEEIRRAAMSAGPDPKGMARAAADAAVKARAGSGPPTLEELASDQMAPFRRRVVAKSIRPLALPRLRSSMSGLYDYRRGASHVTVDKEGAKYMRHAGTTLKAALCHMIAARLEEINPAMRHAATKIRQDMDYDGRLRKVIGLESKSMEQKEEIGSLLSISSDLTAGLERLAALRT